MPLGGHVLNVGRSTAQRWGGGEEGGEEEGGGEEGGEAQGEKEGARLQDAFLSLPVLDDRVLGERRPT